MLKVAIVVYILCLASILYSMLLRIRYQKFNFTITMLDTLVAVFVIIILRNLIVIPHQNPILLIALGLILFICRIAVIVGLSNPKK